MSIFAKRIAFVLGLLIVASGSFSAWADDEPVDSFDVDPVVSLLELVIDADVDTATKCLAVLTEKIQSGEVSPPQAKSLQVRLETTLREHFAGQRDDPLRFDAALLAATWRDPNAVDIVKKVFEDRNVPSARRLKALGALVMAKDADILPVVSRILQNRNAQSLDFRAAVISVLGRMDHPSVADLILASYDRLDPQLRPKTIELLTQRSSWSKQLLEAIGRKELPASVLNANQIRKLLAGRDEELTKLVIARWGTVRTERNPQRDQVIAQMHDVIVSTPGDPHKGQAVFKKVCGQCHRIYGEGQEVGPDITGNGRASFAQLLSNVFDPSLVIGASYQARTVITADGRVLTGLLVEDNDQRIVLKMQGGKQETIAREDVDEMQISKLSLMPEGLEKQISNQEIVDLFAFITLDKPPIDPNARRIPGTPELKLRDDRSSVNPSFEADSAK